MSTRSGAWVARARLQARLGSPMPTKTTSPSRSSRAATVVIISAGVYLISVPIVHPRAHPAGRAQALQSSAPLHVLRPVPDAEHELIEIALERRAVASTSPV